MMLRRIGMAGALLGVLALPAAAQTMQTTPQKPAPSITTKPGAAGTATNASGARSPATVSPAPASTQNGAATTKLVDINSASETDLDALPGIGKARAAAIIKNRPYKGKDDLQTRHVLPTNVYNGIKDKIIAKQS